MSPLTDPKEEKPQAPQSPALVDIAAIRTRLANSHGRDYWRSLEELSETAEFQDFVKHEFPRDVELWMEPMSRRGFVKLMGASLAMAFFSGCRKPLESIVPYNKAPEDVVPGKPLFFASALPFQGYARGVLVENHMGRPTKIEGNPAHPDSLGSTDIFMQAATLSFYDPDRSQVVTHRGSISTWTDYLESLSSAAGVLKAKGGAGLRILTETVTSPSLGAQLREFQGRFPDAQWHQYEPARGDGVQEGALLAFDRPVATRYQFDRADVIVSLESDFLIGMPGSMLYTRDFATRRSAGDENSGMNRLYVMESDLSVTGTMADHRLPLRPAAIEVAARMLASELGVREIAASGDQLSSAAAAWVTAVARDLQKHAGASLVIAGDAQPPVVHALAHAMNHALGNVGRTVVYTDPVEVAPVNHMESLRRLVADMRAGRVDSLLILGGNPVFTAPADLDFPEALAKVPWSAHLGLYEDETSALCRWHLPEAHALESWGDLRAYDGSVSIIQPQIQPLYDGKTASEILSGLLEAAPRSSHDIVHDFWKGRTHLLDFEGFWRKTLNDGVMALTALSPKRVSLKTGFAREPQALNAAQGLELVFKPDPTIGDGRHANNGWLQELPKPVTKLTWDNAALMAPALAERLGVGNGDVVELELQGRSLKAPVWLVPGHADRSVTITLGYGRTRAGRVGDGAGFNAYALRTSRAPWSSSGLTVRKTGRNYKLASTQHHYSMEGRDLVRVATLAEYERNPRFAQEPDNVPAAKETLYDYSKPPQSPDYAWGMSIDLNKCIGCNACMVACQAENNIPIVGKEEVAKGREMHWIRVDRYYSGDLENPSSYNQPVACMHCEDAPCEVVCPVGATSHSDEGLNQMVYNRCIGTRYCSNNCPYKVRRFNFMDYTAHVTGPLKMLENPDVTVRSRGVMEKCTYCVQRISCAKIGAEEEGRLVRDGEITPACAQACPAHAIVFGNLKDNESEVVQRKADPRDYGLLTELGTRPRTTYLARLRNPNPEIVEIKGS
jgi:MoCo/4Fe-4S cofactor protein with predicted Tat translocation signal